MEETFNPAALTRSDTITSTLSTTKNASSSASKAPKVSQSYPRIDFEPLYAELKSLIADNWGSYYDALTRFIRGELSASEFSDLCDHFILSTPATEHAHNSIVCAIIHNTGRDSPEPGPAAFISLATDKSSGPSSSKLTLPTSDASEQRLKGEIMSLPARDRRRLKAIGTDANNKITSAVSAEEEASHIRAAYEAEYKASRIKAPENIPASTAGLAKTNWEPEIRKRFTQPLFSETLEFPDANAIQARITPICYQHGLVQGASPPCAELVAVAAETFVKNLLHDVFSRTRSNGPSYENSAGNGIFTAKYKKVLAKEDAEVRAGRLSRNHEDSLLPTESKEAQNRRPLTIADLKLANSVGPKLWNGMPTIGAKVDNMLYDAEHPWNESQTTSTSGAPVATNGASEDYDDDEDQGLDDQDLGWEGASRADQVQLKELMRRTLDLAGPVGAT